MRLIVLDGLGVGRVALRLGTASLQLISLILRHAPAAESPNVDKGLGREIKFKYRVVSPSGFTLKLCTSTLAILLEN